MQALKWCILRDTHACVGPNNPHSAHQHVVAPHTYADVLIHRTVVACEVTSSAFLPLLRSEPWKMKSLAGGWLAQSLKNHAWIISECYRRLWGATSRKLDLLK